MGPTVRIRAELPVWLAAILVMAVEGLVGVALFALLPDTAAAIVWMAAMLGFTGWAVWQVRRGRAE